MKRKTLLICAAAVIVQMGFFTGCSDDKSKDTPENAPTVSESETPVISQYSSEISPDIKNETANSDNITSTDTEFIELEDDIPETSQSVSVQSESADNKAVTTKNNTSRKETTTKMVTTAASSESKTTVNTRDAIELPEIEFN